MKSPGHGSDMVYDRDHFIQGCVCMRDDSYLRQKRRVWDIDAVTKGFLKKNPEKCNQLSNSLLFIDEPVLTGGDGITDKQIVELLFARSEESIPALQSQYGAYCSAIVQRFLTDPRDVEECLDDCYMTVWRSIPPTYPEYFKGWLGAIVRHQALAIAKKNDRRPPEADEAALEMANCLPCAEDSYSDVEAKDLSRAVSDFLWKQKTDARIAFIRRYWYADNIEAVASRMGWSVSKTKSVLFRVRNHLKRYLDKEGLL